LWEWFNEIGRSRRNYGWGATPIQYSEIQAWCNLRQVKLDAWELETIINLDTAYLSFVAANKVQANDGDG